MATKYKDGDRQFSTDSDEVAIVAIENGLLRSSRPNIWSKAVQSVRSVLVLVPIFERMFGNPPNGP